MFGIYHANLAQSFVPPHYAAEFEEQLTDPATLTLVFTTDDRVLGCGSVTCLADGTAAWLSYGLVHPDYQRRGIGSAMLLMRMSLLPVTPERPCAVYLSATRHSRSFFSKHGFAFRGAETDPFGNEFETYCLPLSAALVDSIRQSLKRSGVDCDEALPVPHMEERLPEPAASD